MRIFRVPGFGCAADPDCAVCAWSGSRAAPAATDPRTDETMKSLLFMIRPSG
jgi:hypothetical protein